MNRKYGPPAIQHCLHVNYMQNSEKPEHDMMMFLFPLTMTKFMMLQLILLVCFFPEDETVGDSHFSNEMISLLFLNFKNKKIFILAWAYTPDIRVCVLQEGAEILTILIATLCLGIIFDLSRTGSNIFGGGTQF